jgi:anti-sigma B factor antagonist
MLEISLELIRRGETHVHVRGALDCASCGQLQKAITKLINRGGTDTIGIDLRGVDFIDSTGVGTLVVAQRICQGVGIRLRLTAASAFASRLLGIVGVDEVLGLPAPAAAEVADESALVATT